MADMSFVQTDGILGGCGAAVRMSGAIFPANCVLGPTNDARLAVVSGTPGSTPRSVSVGLANGDQSWVSFVLSMVPGLTSWPWTTLRVPLNVTAGNSDAQLLGMAAGRTSNFCVLLETLGYVDGLSTPLTTGVHTIDIPINTVASAGATNRLVVEVVLFNSTPSEQTIEITPDQTIDLLEPAGIVAHMHHEYVTKKKRC